MQDELRSYGLVRYPVAKVGKRIRNHLWVHVNYLAHVSKALKSHPLWAALPGDAQPVIARINLKNWNDLTLIECPEFDRAHEPEVGRAFTLKLDQQLSITKPTRNPLIYHHKWLFVDDQYAGFNVVASKKRSLSWRRLAGTNAHLSARIGRQDYWHQWLESVGLAK